MTNVPQTIRDAWADVYKLFDITYGMDGSEQSWIAYWERANQLILKYGDEIPLLEMFTAVAHMIETFCNERRTKNKTLTWGKNEDYPHPKGDMKNGD